MSASPCCDRVACRSAFCSLSFAFRVLISPQHFPLLDSDREDVLLPLLTFLFILVERLSDSLSSSAFHVNRNLSVVLDFYFDGVKQLSLLSEIWEEEEAEQPSHPRRPFPAPFLRCFRTLMFIIIITFSFHKISFFK